MGEPKLTNKFEKETKEIMNIDELRAAVLNAVADESFDEAIDILQQFLNQPSDYPQFRHRMSRLVGHAIDLVNAIRAKKNFPGLNNLTRSKQQEIGERIKDHFNELQLSMSKMERVAEQLRREDVRSTLWIMRAVIYACGVIVIVAFLKEVTGGLWSAFENVMGNVIDRGLDWVIHFFK